MKKIKRCQKTLILLLFAFNISYAEDVASIAEKSPYSELWLEYKAANPDVKKAYEPLLKNLYSPGNRPILINAQNELRAAINRMVQIHVETAITMPEKDALMVGTLRDFAEDIPAELKQQVNQLTDHGRFSDEGFLILSQPNNITYIISKTDRGVLYGVFHFIRLLQTERAIKQLTVVEEPDVDLRMLNHWDNLDRRVERGYAGKSLWEWDQLPDHVPSRVHEYARFCASLGINATVLNNVNADPNMLTKENLEKVAAMSSVFRDWGIQTFLSVNFASPIKPDFDVAQKVKWKKAKQVGIGNLDTADPLNQDVIKWWENKFREVYNIIPDFGGILVKADSEGMPGPNYYNRSHVEGADMLANAIAPYGGLVFWRAFVYETDGDRALDAYKEFKRYDGMFSENTFLQVKNGPLDFQPREPFTPLFGAMPNTDLALELQITKEYLGQSKTMTFLAPQWHDVLMSDTYAKGDGSLVARVIDGSLHKRSQTAIAGVANTGHFNDWCGNIFNQANWYAFGRISWDLSIKPDVIAEEWIKMTFGCDDSTLATIKDMMLRSYQAYVDYSMPMGMVFLSDYDHLMPKPKKRRYYHGGNANGLGIDRTTSGSDYVSQYHENYIKKWNDVNTISLDYLLWFHHVKWDQKLSSGRTLIDELEYRYSRGVNTIADFIRIWEGLDGKIDSAKYASILKTLNDEEELARHWQEVCVTYFKGLANKIDAGKPE